MVKNNNAVVRPHKRKDWQSRVEVNFDQEARKTKRRLLRKQKSEKLAPRPLNNLRPVVRCMTRRYNHRQRLGRGFSTAELEAVKLNMH
mmetsp:Transcript_75311/g.162861  ORF Transcript_75311/g.162861 Transcript_75311/m.162861 type:complete len:88 (+) Transcript_75311:38-301(+)